MIEREVGGHQFKILAYCPENRGKFSDTAMKMADMMEENNIDGYIVVFNLRERFEKETLRNYLEKINAARKEESKIVLVGSVSDRVTLRIVERETAEAFAEEFNIPYFEVSAKLDTNVTEAVNAAIPLPGDFQKIKSARNAATFQQQQEPVLAQDQSEKRTQNKNCTIC